MVVSNIFYVHPYLGKIPILTNRLKPPTRLGWLQKFSDSRVVKKDADCSIHVVCFCLLIHSFVFVYSLGKTLTYHRKITGWKMTCPFEMVPF